MYTIDISINIYPSTGTSTGSVLLPVLAQYWFQYCKWLTGRFQVR